MRIHTVDEFVKQKVATEFKPVVIMLRKLMREQAPNAQEVYTYGLLGWKQNRIIAVLSPTQKDITFSFSRGASFEDSYGLLTGVGKISKYVKIKKAREANVPALKYYIKQAINLDAKQK